MKEHAKPLWTHDGQQKYWDFDEVLQFQKCFNEMAQSIEADCDEMIRRKCARGIIKKGKAFMADLEKASAKVWFKLSREVWGSWPPSFPDL